MAQWYTKEKLKKGEVCSRKYYRITFIGRIEDVVLESIGMFLVFEVSDTGYNKLILDPEDPMLKDFK